MVSYSYNIIAILLDLLDCYIKLRAMAVASGPAGPVLAGPVFEMVFNCACAE